MNFCSVLQYDSDSQTNSVNINAAVIIIDIKILILFTLHLDTIFTVEVCLGSTKYRGYTNKQKVRITCEYYLNINN